MGKPLVFQGLITEIPLHGVHFHHGVADRGAGGVNDPAIAAQHRPHLDEHIGGLGRAGRVDAGQATHGSLEFQVLEGMGLVHKQAVYAQFGKGKSVLVLVGDIGQGAQLLYQRVLHFLHVAHRSGFLTLGRRQHGAGFFQVADLLLDEFLLLNRVGGQFGKGGMRNDHRVPVAGGDPAEHDLAAQLGKIFLVRDQNVRVGVELLEFGGPLLNQVVRHHQHGLFHHAGAAQFHDRANQRHGLAGADNVVGKGGGRLHHPPHKILLVFAQSDDVVGHLAGHLQVRAVIAAGHIGVVGLVIDFRQPLPAVGVIPQPVLELLLDFVLLLLGRLGRLDIGVAFAVCVLGRYPGNLVIGGQQHQLKAIHDPGAPLMHQVRREVAGIARPASNGRGVVEGRASPAASQVVDKLTQHFRRHPGRADLHLDVGGLDVLRQYGFQGGNVRGISVVLFGRRFGLGQLHFHVAGQVFIAGRPAANWIGKYQAAQLLGNGVLGFAIQALHVGHINSAHFGQGDGKGFLGARYAGHRHIGRLGTLGENVGLLRARVARRHAFLPGDQLADTGVVVMFQRRQLRPYRV